jgi:integrase
MIPEVTCRRGRSAYAWANHKKEIVDNTIRIATELDAVRTPEFLAFVGHSEQPADSSISSAQAATLGGRASIDEDLVFPSYAGTPLKPDNIAIRYMQPALARAGLRHFRLHDLRHTFGSLLIQDGAPLTYVKEQMGHSSIQVTVDTYGHLVPGAGVGWVDRQDSLTGRQQTATHLQPAAPKPQADSTQVSEKKWLPPRDSNPDMLIQS